MRKIQITKELHDQVLNFYLDPFHRRSAQFELPLVLLDKLSKKRGFKSGKRNKYISDIIKYYDTLVSLKPSQVQKWIDHFDAILPTHHKQFTTKFWASIVEAMRYEEMRSKEFLSLYKDLNIKACCYCNAQLTVVANVSFYKKPRLMKGLPKERRATFELDHFYPKSKHPFLATSFYNLYPSCSVCNKAKSTNPIDFKLYEETSNLDVFTFVLDRKTEQRYWKTKNREDLEFKFQAINPIDDSLRDEYNEMFHIQGIYETQKDIIEDLLNIRDTYSKGYKAGLVSLANKKLFSDEAMIKKMLIGNYYRPEDVHKRPLAKFTQDIAKQIRLI
jgi:hypothetical protein